MNNRNITLGYVLITLQNSFFWYAPWLLYVYQYIDIKQATLLQLIGLLTRVIAEIPSGTVADLMGKKKTLLIAFFLSGLGEITMAFSTTFSLLVVSYVINSLGSSFFSGTIDAFMYDSLLEKKDEKKYPSVLGKSNAYQNMATAIATLTGGFMFQIWGGLPFLITGIAKFAGMFIAFRITEPTVDTFSFSAKNFVNQTAKGIRHLFSKNLIRLTLLTLLMGSFSVVVYEILDDVAVVDWGYSATSISILYTTVILLSIPSSFLYERVAKVIKPPMIVVGAILILVINYIFSPLINVYVWSFIFLLRVIYSPLKTAAVTDIINTNVASNIRATTLSTYELLIRIPFVMFGVYIGTSLKDMGVKNFSVLFSGSLLMLLLIYFLIILIIKLRKTTNNRNAYTIISKPVG
ncbi:MAG: MFS transporter [Candidatus Shapirobacteria bacterium]